MQMIWEQGSIVIVNLTRLSENGVSVCHRYWPEEGSDLYHIYEVRPQFTLCRTVYRLVRSVNVKYFVSHKAHRAALISAFLSINQIIQY